MDDFYEPAVQNIGFDSQNTPNDKQNNRFNKYGIILIEKYSGLV